MKVCWVVADNTILDHTVDLEQLKNVGSVWGSWKTWRNCGTDNAICNEIGQARDLIKRGFQTKCNFYVPKSLFVDLDRPDNVKLYAGEFTFEIDCPEEVIALNLVASNFDIVLLLGFDWTEKPKLEDRLLEHRAHNYRLAIDNVITDNPDTQWVLVNHPGKVSKALSKKDNLTQDTLENVLAMLDA